MKTAIFYFSGTGNNYYIATRIAKELGDTDIFPIRVLQGRKKMDAKYDWIGFIGPSYYSHIPPFMSECMKGIRYKKNQKIFTVCGCGGNRGLALQDMRQCIRESNHAVSLEYMAVEPGNYLLSYGAFPKLYQSITVFFTDRKAKKIVRDIRENKRKKPLKKGIFYREKYEERLQEAIAEFKEKGKQFKVSDSCVGCGGCERVCPVGNIRVKNGIVEFSNHCNQCMACIQWCGKRAISVNEKERKRKRYHHPRVMDSSFNSMGR